MSNAARIGDNHLCPVHEGGPAMPPGAPDVLINNLPVVGATDQCVCKGPVDFIVTGAATVHIANKLAARLTDKTMHGAGMLVGNSPDVLIGGATAGVAIGGGGSGLGAGADARAACEALAAGRSSGAKNQSYGNCGVESARQIINRHKGAGLSEEALVNDAVANGDVDERTPRDSQFGGTGPSERSDILDRHGVANSQMSATRENLIQAAAEGRGVITSHDAGVLWNNPANNGDGHAVVMTGMIFGPDGQPTHVIINDTGRNNRCADPIPADQFFNSLRPGRKANVTDERVWR